MAGILETVATKIGVPGRRKYETTPKLPPFSGLTFKEKLQRIVFEKRIANRQTRMRMNMVHYLMALYYRGYQQIEINASGDAFNVFERPDYHIENQFRVHVDTVKEILNQMEGDVVVRPATDSPRDLATARVADPILEMQRDTVEYDRLIDQKNLNRCLFGSSFQFTDYVTDKKYGSIVTPKFSYETQQGEDGEDILTKSVTGYSTRYKGRQIAAACTPLEINTTYDVLPFTQVPFLQWISRQDIELLEYLYPGFKVDAAGTQAESDLAQYYVDLLGNLPGNIFGDSAEYSRLTSQGTKGELVRSWLQPCTFRGDSELEKEFPNGAHVTTINGKLVDFYEEDLTERWTHEVLIPVPHSLFGDGLYDAILMQDQINLTDSLILKHILYSTVGHNIYDANMIDPKDVVNDPENGWVPAKPSVDKSVAQAVFQVQPNHLSGDVPAWLASRQSAMQDMTGAHNPAQGKEIGANSPYSQSVFLTEKAQSRWKGSRKYNRPEMIRFHRMLLEDARNNWVDMRQQAVVDNTGSWSFQQFSQSDLQGDVDILLSDTDFKPRSRAEQVQALQMLTQLAQIIPNLPPKQKLRIEEMLGLPPDANPMSNQISRAERMIDRITKGEVVSPLPLVDDAQAQVPVFADFLASEKGEQLAETDPEAFANVYQYMTTLLMMTMMQQSSPGGAMALQIQKPPLPQGPNKQQPSPPSPQGTPGGQPGQQGGGNPNPGSQAQSPAVAPPVPPAPTGNSQS